MWDMRYTPLDLPAAYPMGAIYKNTEPAKTSPWVMPGAYTATLTVDGKSFTKQFTVTMDPRVHIALKALQQQHDLALLCYQGRLKTMKMKETIVAAKDKLVKQAANNTGTIKNSQPLDDELAVIEKLNRAFSGLHDILEEADMQATTQTIAAVAATQKQLQDAEKKWEALKVK
jgi:hypothetical protein